MKLALAGAGVGLIGAVGLSRLIAFAFPGLELQILPALAATAAILIVVALAACYIPSKRAATINPTDALRAE